MKVLLFLAATISAAPALALSDEIVLEMESNKPMTEGLPAQRIPALARVYQHFQATGSDPACFNIKIELPKEEIYAGSPTPHREAMVVWITLKSEYFSNKTEAWAKCGRSRRYVVGADGSILLSANQR